MDLLTDLWNKTTDAASSLTDMLSNGLVRLVGNSNERVVRRHRSIAAVINELEPSIQALSDAQLMEKTTEFRRRLADGKTLDDLLPEAFAVCREAGRRFMNMRHYDVQLVGGMVLHGGNIAEMITGEGKTLVATLAAYLNALEGKGVHVVTVNDYLARRDAEWMSPLFHSLGMTIGAIQSDMDPRERLDIYRRDITYGTNNEFGFDYLRDNMKPMRDQQCQQQLNYAIIDEVDSILIDEARTPLIISGPADDDITRYVEADRVARLLQVEKHFEIKEKERTCHLTEEGVREAEKLAGVESFYTLGNMDWPHLLDNSLKAHHLYRRDREYVVINGEIIIVDEFTGRLMQGRQWSDGLHQAVEAKERVQIKAENQTLATVTLQNFFKLYKKLSGMTGTAMTEANEFMKVYNLDVIAIPTNRGLQRVNFPDTIYCTEAAKFKSIVDEIRDIHDKQRPILVGTTSIEKSELLSDVLKRHGIEHQVLNAKYHEREAEIVAQAGRKAAVTIATNMAGRGTDIILGGNPEFMAWADLKNAKDADGRPLYPTRLEVPPDVWRQAVQKYEDTMKVEGREVAQLGGLHIIGTERHESRRIDNQLRGRSGRQGDPGSSRFFLSLEDDLMRKFGGDWLKNVLSSRLIGMQEEDAIESPMVSRRIEANQKKMEERNFDIRKNLLEYDEVMDQQRKKVYGFRQGLLENYPPKLAVLEMIDRQIDSAVKLFLDPDYGVSSFTEWAGPRLGCELTVKEFRNLRFDEAVEAAKARASQQAEPQLDEAIEEHLPADVDFSDWNLQAIAHWVKARYGVDVKDRDLLRMVPRDGEPHRVRGEIRTMFLEKIRPAVDETDLTAAREFLEQDWGRRSLAGWMQHKFNVQAAPEIWADMNASQVADNLKQGVRQLYDAWDAHFPVHVHIARHFREATPGTAPQYDREGFAAWFSDRYEVEFDPRQINDMFRPEIEALCLGLAERSYQGGKVANELLELAGKSFVTQGRGKSAREVPQPESLKSLAQLARTQLGLEMTPDDWSRLGSEETKITLQNKIDEVYRPEMRELEKVVLLHIVDGAWMEHLRTMDHLRSSVGLRGYAQVDPKVEYKREGLRIFQDMWDGVADKVTDLIFRMEQFDPGFLGSLASNRALQRAKTIHEAAPSAYEDVPEGSAAAAAGTPSEKEGESRKEPVRRSGKKVGRNDPCPCGSGKKYKACCMRHAEHLENY
jgi:preprotein translocase subunit SecA